MKTLRLIWFLVVTQCLAGPGIFMNQQGLQISNSPISGFSFSDYFTDVLSIIPQQDPALSSGAGAATVTDLSGNGVDFTQSTSAARPTWKTAATPSGMASLNYDGTDDWLTAGNKLDLGLNSRTIFIAVKRNSGSCGLLCKTKAAGADGRWGAFIDAGTAYGFWSSMFAVYIAGGSDTDTGWQLLTFVMDRTNGNKVRKNGVQIATDSSAESSNNWNTTFALMLGAYGNSTDGLTPASGFYLNGEIAAVGVANSALATGTLEDVEDALGSYLGITITH